MKKWQPKIHIDPELATHCDICSAKMGIVAHAELCKQCVENIHIHLEEITRDVGAGSVMGGLKPECCDTIAINLRSLLKIIENLL
jgi:hypothetical protein